MKIKLRSDRYLYLGMVIFSIFSLLPITRLLPSLVKAGLVLTSIFLCFISAINYSRSERGKKAQFFFLAFVLIAVINLLIYIGEYCYLNEFNFASKYLMMIAFWMPFLAQMLFYFVKNSELIDKIQKIVWVLLMITAISTIVGSFLFAEASRALASNDVEANRIYQLFNIGGYGFIYSLVLSIPWIIYKYKIKKEKKYILFLGIVMLCILKSSYMTAILLAIFACGVCLLFPKRERYNFIFFSVSILFAIIVSLLCNSKDFWEYLITIAGNSDTLVFRLRNLRDLFLISNITGDIGLRSSLYMMSWNSFLKSPVWGNIGNEHPNELGYHSELFDCLGGSGILGIFIMILSIMTINYVRNKKNTTFDIKKKYSLIAWVMFLILCTINTVIGSIEISTVLALLYFPELKESTN